MLVYSEHRKFEQDAEALARHLGAARIDAITPENARELKLCFRKDGLFLEGGKLAMAGDFEEMLPRVREEMWQHEMLVKAAKIRNEGAIEAATGRRRTVIDCTAGMGEDSLLLAAAGYEVTLYEHDPVICALLKDTLRRAKKNPVLKDMVLRMHVVEGDSIEALGKLLDPVDIIYMDPMFPERQKSSLIKKKFQLLQQLEAPGMEEDKMLEAALRAGAQRILIKRPAKGPFVGNIKPDYSISGKSIRYDCIAR